MKPCFTVIQLNRTINTLQISNGRVVRKVQPKSKKAIKIKKSVKIVKNCIEKDRLFQTKMIIYAHNLIGKIF